MVSLVSGLDLMSTIVISPSFNSSLMSVGCKPQELSLPQSGVGCALEPAGFSVTLRWSDRRAQRPWRHHCVCADDKCDVRWRLLEDCMVAIYLHTYCPNILRSRVNCS